ncbi:MAG: MarR family transcriptional regulator [Deltaproteobacteria bacterium]|nr:MarR family transcriptional regulator [Deltaproteobacteria bacterium]MBW2018062.1 MarR family transcriptional regulator [Deltaproteobacteria bacterium]MBW2304785.1 MarR family transcriptional regulator [Deltaproteobacteria bacterium]
MKDRQHEEPAIEVLVDEVVALYHLLRVIAARIHSGTGLTAAMRGILRGLDRLGPQTVPQMARARPVSRQYIQALVNRLQEEGYVETTANPAHKRSGIVRLTRRGETLIEAMRRTEAHFLEGLGIDIDGEEIKDAISVLRRLRRIFVGVTRNESRSTDST